MDPEFPKRNEQFLKVQSEFERGLLTKDQYIKEVDNLRFQNSRGTWWQPRYEDGVWLQWDGRSWIPVVELPTKNIPSKTEVSGEIPDVPFDSIPKFLGFFLKNMGTAFVKNIPWMVLIAVIIWFIHVLFLISSQENGIINTNSLPGSILIYPGNSLEGIIFWILLAWIVSAVVLSARKGSLNTGFQKISTTPMRVRDAWRDAYPYSLALFVTFLGAALLIATLIGNTIISLQLTLIIIAFVVSQPEGIPYCLFQLGWKASKSQVDKSPDNPFFRSGCIATAFLGLGVGFLISVPVKVQDHPGEIMMIFLLCLLISGISLYLSKRRQVKNPHPIEYPAGDS